MNIETKLHVEIDDELDALSKMEKGSDQWRATVDGVAKLIDRAIEIDRLNADCEEKEKIRSNEIVLRNKQMREERVDRIVKNCLSGASLVGGIGLTVWGALKSWEFEKEGTVTTMIGRGFMNKLLPKK